MLFTRQVNQTELRSFNISARYKFEAPRTYEHDMRLDQKNAVSLRGFLLVLFLAEPKHRQIWAIEIGYAYIEENINDKVYVIAGPDLPDNAHDWTYSVYGNVFELLPTVAPDPLGNYVTLSHYVDVNLLHGVTTGRSVTGILHLASKPPLNGIPINKQHWKQQLMVQNLLLH
jgi:hypothetical protein